MPKFFNHHQLYITVNQLRRVLSYFSYSALFACFILGVPSSTNPSKCPAPAQKPTNLPSSSTSHPYVALWLKRSNSEYFFYPSVPILVP